MKSLSLPPLFREALTDAGMLAIDAWWSHLDDLSRDEALRLWEDCNRGNGTLSVRVEGRFVEEEEEQDPSDFWHNDYYDYLVNHEAYLFEVPGVHICTAHPVAAAAARAGFVPADFSCPLKRTDCAMRQVLNRARGKSLRLRVVLHLKSRV